MNRKQRRAAKAQGNGEPMVRLSIAAPDQAAAKMAADILAFVMKKWPGQAPEDIDRKALVLMSLSASFAAVLPAGLHRDAVIKGAPEVFQQLVTRAVANDIDADPIEEAMGDVTPEKLEALKFHAAGVAS